jgi:hypothetical protein
MVSYHSFPFHQEWHSPWNTQKQLTHAVSPLDTAQKQIHFVHSAQTIECCAIIMNFAMLAPGRKPGHLGYPIFSGRLIRNSGNENCYPICVLKKNTTRKFGYPIIRIRVRVLPDIPKFMENNQLH